MGSFDIYASNTDGTSLRRLTRNRLWEYNPDWSPTGSHIAFDRAGSVFVMSADGGSQRRIAREGGDPSWSPDATKIVYFGIHAFRTMNADGSGKRQLFPPVYSCPECGEPDWSE